MVPLIWSWLKSKPWLVLPIPMIAVGWLWRWIRAPRERSEVAGPTLTTDQARDARERIQDAKDRKLGEIEGRWDDLREKWTKWNGGPK